MGLLGAERAWGWVAHLREGGTTPWAAWHRGGAPCGRVVPGAQQLELLRRLNLAGRPTTRLADRVLTASAPGRGQLDLELVGARPESPFGPRPVDPAELPLAELVRVATSLLAEDLVAFGAPERRRALTRPWGRRYRIAGDPLVVGEVRGQLLARGRPPGGARVTAYVVGGPLDRMLADTWTRLTFEQGSSAWPDWIRHWRGRDQLPPRIDLAAVADVHARRLGRDRVRIVLDEAALARQLGRRRLAAPRRPAADAVELARRVAQVLGLLVMPARRQELLEQTLWPRLAGLDDGPAIAVPEEHREWMTRRAARLVRQLRRAGYPVVGDLADLTPTPAAGTSVRTPDEGGVLDLAVRMLLSDAEGAGQRAEERA